MENKDYTTEIKKLLDRSDEELFAKQVEIWNEPSLAVPQSDINNAYQRIEGLMGKERSRRRLLLMASLSVAAAIAVAAFVCWQYISPGDSPVVQEQRYAEICTRHEGVKVLTLEDGTTVHLNSETSLVYPHSMTGSVREVFLTGQAFFEVAKDTLRPFIVHASDCDIRVTGTKFDVRAYPDENLMTTSLLEGGVEISMNGVDNPVILNPGWRLSIDCESGEFSKESIREHEAPNWHNGEFSASNKTFAQIARDLERRDGVRIVIRKERIANKLFYISFVNGETTEEILNALNVSKEFRIRNENGVYFIE